MDRKGNVFVGRPVFTGVRYLMQFAGTVILVGINEKYIKQMSIRSPTGN